MPNICRLESDRVEICRQTVCTSEKETLSYISEVLFALNIGQSLTDTKKKNVQRKQNIQRKQIRQRYKESIFHKIPTKYTKKTNYTKSLFFVSGRNLVAS